MVAEKTQQAFEAIAAGLLGDTQHQTDTRNMNDEEVNVAERIAQVSQNITDQKEQNVQIDKDHGRGI